MLPPGRWAVSAAPGVAPAAEPGSPAEGARPVGRRLGTPRCAGTAGLSGPGRAASGSRAAAGAAVLLGSSSRCLWRRGRGTADRRCRRLRSGSACPPRAPAREGASPCSPRRGRRRAPGSLGPSADRTQRAPAPGAPSPPGRVALGRGFGPRNRAGAAALAAGAPQCRKLRLSVTPRAGPRSRQGSLALQPHVPRRSLVRPFGRVAPALSAGKPGWPQAAARCFRRGGRGSPRTPSPGHTRAALSFCPESVLAVVAALFPDVRPLSARAGARSEPTPPRPALRGEPSCGSRSVGAWSPLGSPHGSCWPPRVLLRASRLSRLVPRGRHLAPSCAFPPSGSSLRPA